MPWYLILKSLYDYLTEAHVADVIKLGIPEANSVMTESGAVVYLSRDSEINPNIYHGGEGSVNLELGFFVTDSDPDFGLGYKKLSDLEKAVQVELESWAAQDMPVAAVEVMHVSVNAAGGNVYCERPIIGSYLNIKIDWSLRTL